MLESNGNFPEGQVEGSVNQSLCLHDSNLCVMVTNDESICYRKQLSSLSRLFPFQYVFHHIDWVFMIWRMSNNNKISMLCYCLTLITSNVAKYMISMLNNESSVQVI